MNSPDGNSLLKKKLDDAYSDLEHLKKTLKDLKSSNENIRTSVNFRTRCEQMPVLITDDSLAGFTRSFTNNYDQLERNNNNVNLNARTPSTRGSRNDRNDGRRNYNYIESNYNSNYNSNANSPLKENLYSNGNKSVTMNMGNKKNGLDIIRDFKEILKESDKHTAQIGNKVKELNSNEIKELNELREFKDSKEFNNFNISTRTNLNNLNANIPEQNSQTSYTQFLTKINSTGLKDEIERLKISNKVLNKSNLDLKNQNRLLIMELDSLRENTVFNFSNNFNFDQNLSNFIENLKTALNSSQMSNQELNQIIENLQQKNSEICNENIIYKDQFEISRKEVESLNKKLSEAKINSEDSFKQNKFLTNELAQLKLRLEEKEEKIRENNEKINNLITINENNHKNKNDLNSMIENLKNTIEIMKKGNVDYEKERGAFKIKIDELQNSINNKDYDIENLNNKIESCEKDKQHLNEEMKLLRDEINNKENTIEEMQHNYKCLLIDLNRNKNKMETMTISQEEKDLTIENLKSSLNFITQTLNEIKTENEKLKSEKDQILNEKNKQSKNLELNEKKIKDLSNSVEDLNYNKDDLLKSNLILENELNDKRNKLSAVILEFDILTQKYSDQSELILQLKEENKQNRHDKITEDFSINFIRNNDEKIKRISELNAELKRKSSELEMMKTNYESKLNFKEEKIKELSLNISNNLNKDKEKEREFINENKSFKFDNEKLKKEIKRLQLNFENEKRNLSESNEKLQNDYNNLAVTLNRIEENYYDVISKNKVLESNILQLHYSSKVFETDVDAVAGVSNVNTDNIESPKYYIGDKMSHNKNIINSENKYKGGKHKHNHSQSNVSNSSYKNKNGINLMSNMNNVNNGNNINIPLKKINSKKSSSRETLSGLIKINTENKIEESPHIYTVFDNQRIISFDLIEKQFKIVQFEDLADFSQSYIPEGSITLNSGNGIYIVTGKDFNSFYFYAASTNTMNKFQNLTHSHNGGALVYYPKTNSLICLSGRYNKKAEKISLELDFAFGMDLNSDSNYNDNNDNVNFSNTKWTNLPDLLYDRTNAAYIIINNYQLYSLFGYSYLTASYINTIERLNLERDYLGSDFKWEEVKFTIDNTNPFSLALKSFFCAQLEHDDEIWILGGYDGNDFEENKNILKFNYFKNTIELNVDKKIPENIIPVNFSKENQVVIFKDNFSNDYMAIIDDSFKVHIFDNQFSQYEVVDFSY